MRGSGGEFLAQSDGAHPVNQDLFSNVRGFVCARDIHAAFSDWQSMAHCRFRSAFAASSASGRSSLATSVR